MIQGRGLLKSIRDLANATASLFYALYLVLRTSMQRRAFRDQTHAPRLDKIRT